MCLYMYVSVTNALAFLAINVPHFPGFNSETINYHTKSNQLRKSYVFATVAIFGWHLKRRHCFQTISKYNINSNMYTYIYIESINIGLKDFLNRSVSVCVCCVFCGMRNINILFDSMQKNDTWLQCHRVSGRLSCVCSSNILWVY